MPAQPSSMVPHGPLHTSFWRFLPLSTFCQQSPIFHLTLTAQYLRPLGLFYCRPDCLKLWPKTCGVPILQLIVSGQGRRQDFSLEGAASRRRGARRRRGWGAWGRVCVPPPQKIFEFLILKWRILMHIWGNLTYFKVLHCNVKHMYMNTCTRQKTTCRLM